jgi:hypothetical protein
VRSGPSGGPARPLVGGRAAYGGGGAQAPVVSAVWVMKRDQALFGTERAGRAVSLESRMPTRPARSATSTQLLPEMLLYEDLNQEPSGAVTARV